MLCNRKHSTYKFCCNNNILKQLNGPDKTQIQRILDHCAFHQHPLYQNRYYWFCLTSDCLLLQKDDAPPRCMVLPPAAVVTSQDQNGNHCCSVLHAALSSADPIWRMQCLVTLSDKTKYVSVIWKTTTEDKIYFLTPIPRLNTPFKIYYKVLIYFISI